MQYVTCEAETAIVAKGSPLEGERLRGIIIWALGEGYLPVGATGVGGRRAVR
jgi:hypothetical protein